MITSHHLLTRAPEAPTDRQATVIDKSHRLHPHRGYAALALAVARACASSHIVPVVVRTSSPAHRAHSLAKAPCDWCPRPGQPPLPSSIGQHTCPCKSPDENYTACTSHLSKKQAIHSTRATENHAAGYPDLACLFLSYGRWAVTWCCGGIAPCCFLSVTRRDE